MASTKNILKSYLAINAASLAADVAGPPVNIQYMDNVAIQIQFGSGATGEFFVQGSNIVNPVTQLPGSSDWVAVPFFDSSGTQVNLTISGSSGQFLLNAQQFAFMFIRVIYTRTSGSGTASAWISTKVL